MGDLHQHADEVGKLVGHVLELGRDFVTTGGIARINKLLGETQRPASQDVQRMVGQVVGEAAVSQEPEQAVVVPHDRLAGAGAVLEQDGRPGVPEENLASGQDAAAHGGLPLGSGGWRVDLVNDVVDLPRDDVDDAIQDVFLVDYVVIERHGLGPELFREPAHRQ